MIKFKTFENLSIGAIERGELKTLLNESELSEGVLSSITNYFSRMLGGSVAKIDKILGKYKDNEIEYWKNWADARGKMAEVDSLATVAKSDPIEKIKYAEQKERIKKLQDQVEKKKENTNDALVRQANGIIKDSARLKDYWEMKKAKVDEEAARESYAEVKKSTDDDTIHDLFDTEIARAAKIAKAKDAEFREKHGNLSDGKFLDQASDADEDLSIAGIKIKDLIAKPISELQQKLKGVSSEQLKSISDYLEKEMKKVKDQRDDDIRSTKNKSDKNQISKDIDDITKKVKPAIDVMQAKIDYIDQLMLSSKGGLKQEIKSNPEIVTDNTKKELGAEGTDKAVQTAIAKTAEVVKTPDAGAVTKVITDQVKKNFEEAKGTIEEAIGEKIEDSYYAHLKNDLISLYGKLVFYYQKLNKEVSSKTLEFGLMDFAAELYSFKKKNNILNKDLSSAELEKQFAKYQK